VARGKEQANTSKKIQICAELSFFWENSEYDCLNFFTNYFDFKNGNVAAH
jgi:hypothetical protein